MITQKRWKLWHKPAELPALWRAQAAWRLALLDRFTLHFGAGVYDLAIASWPP